jgi:cobalt-zinc-cadmium efflux system outer membrane protein
LPVADDSTVSAFIEDRIEKVVQWEPADSLLSETSLLVPDTNLTIDSAVQIGLFNNPSIQALFEEIGIAHADVIEAGLLKNPLFSGLVRFSDQKHVFPDIECSLLQSFIDIISMPLRKKLAEADYQQIQLRVAHGILELAFDIQEAFIHFQAEQTNYQLLAEAVEAAKASHLLAQEQFSAGTVNELEFLDRTNEYLEMNAKLSDVKNRLIHLREKIDKLLGLSDDVNWRIDSALDEILDEEFSMEDIEEIALSQRLDLAIARWEIERIARMYGLKQWWTYTEASLGVSSAQDAEGVRNTGPALSFGIPFFNTGQGDRLRIEALFRQSIHRWESLKRNIVAEGRSVRERLLLQRKLVMDYKKTIVPHHKQVVLLSQAYVNAMALNVYKLLAGKQQELQALMGYNNALKDYWLAKVELDRYIGGHFNPAQIDDQSGGCETR